MKAASAGLDTHFQQEVTSLTMCWKVKRTDGVLFHFTEHDVDLPVDIGDGDGEQTYGASSSYNRSAIKNDDSLAVDNLDLTGVLDSAEIDEAELRRGLFDFAEIHVFIVNWKDLSQGILRMRKGWLGEVIITPNGFFQAELRGLTQALSRNIGEIYTPECRADLGDTRCGVPIIPEVSQRSHEYALGEFVRAASELETVPDATFDARLNTDADDISSNAAVGTLSGARVAIQTVEKKFGVGALECSPNAITDAASHVTYPDLPAYTLGTGAFTLEAHIRIKAQFGTTAEMIMSQFDQSGFGTNGWYWSVRPDLGTFLIVGADSPGFPLAVTSSATTVNFDTWYHVAVTRDDVGDVRFFIDGALISTHVGETGNAANTGAALRLGAFRQISGNERRPMDGFIDNARIVQGVAVYTGAFTAPAAEYPLWQETVDGLPCTSFDDRIYVVTTAGLTVGLQPAYDTTVSNTTADGTAVFTAEQAWSRCIEVIAVESTKPRKGFTVTELTPAVGAGIDGRDQFPSDSMNGGVVIWETGANAGTAMEVRDFTEDDGITIEQVIELFLDLHFDIEIGDTARVYRGCLKRLLPDCKDIFDNVENFRGEPYVPGQDHLTITPDAK